MAIAYKSQGAGVATETTGAALSPLCPAVVAANDILIAHVFWEGIVTGPNTPAGWTLLSGPHIIASTIARHWVFGKIAAGTEDGTAVAFGSLAVTTQRAARIYSFSGYESGTITQLVNGFVETSHATDPQMPTVTTTLAGALAVALVAQNDNNAFAAPTGETGGDWIEAVAEYTAALTPGLSLGIEICTPIANPGTVTGGSMATTNDPCGVIGFQIRQNANVLISVGVANETDTSLALSRRIERAVGVATETDAALALTWVTNLEIPVGTAGEADTAQAVAFTKQQAVGLAQENSAAVTLAISRLVAIGTVLESDTALALTWAVVTEIPVGTASETDAAQSVLFAKMLTLGNSLETSEAVSPVIYRSFSMGVASENNDATPIAFFKQIALGRSDESDLALVGGLQKWLDAGRANELDLGISAVENQIESEVATLRSQLIDFAAAQSSFMGTHGKYCQTMPFHSGQLNTWTPAPADNWTATGANGFGVMDVFPQLQTNISAAGHVSANMWTDEYVSPGGPGYQVSIQYRDSAGRLWIDSIGYGPEAAARTRTTEVTLVL